MNRNQKNLTREQIVSKLVENLHPIDFIHAMYEGGAVAFNRFDQWSDIDLYLVVDEDKTDETFTLVEGTLKSLSPINLVLHIPQLPWPGISQKFYRLEHASEFLLIDLAVLKMSCPEKFLEQEIHGNVLFHFNKSEKIKTVPMDKIAFDKRLQERLCRLKLRFKLFNPFVQKEINRKNSLEAIDAYYNVTLGSLVEALRMKFTPIHYDFKMRYVHYELPKELVARLECLYFVRDAKELQEKYVEATDWFNKTVAEGTV